MRGSLSPCGAGFAITYLSRQLDARHPANWKLLTLLATANNITLGLLYEHRPAAVCRSTVAKVAACVVTWQSPPCLCLCPSVVAEVLEDRAIVKRVNASERC
jgi:hypothetical protein